MPIEDADKVHSKRGQETATINIFGRKIGFIKLMLSIGVGIAAVFLFSAVYLLTLPAPAPVIQEIPNTIIINDTRISFELLNTNYNYKIIKMSYIGNKPIPNIQSELLLSMYPPQSPHYIQRQAIINTNISSFDTKNNTLYIYTGIDNAFHMSNILPTSSDCADFINGEWSLNVDNNITQRNMYNFKYTINNSKTNIIENEMNINESIKNSPDYSTHFVYSGMYKERIYINKPTRLIGINKPMIDAGGSGADITINSNNNIISGFIIINSGNKETANGGIAIISPSSNNLIAYNEIYRTIYGIWVYKSNSNLITNNTIHHNDKDGILLLGSESNTIINNIIYSNINGIKANSESNFNIIKNNNIYDNKDYGVIIDNYPALNNICEYNIYKNNKMACSDSIDRDQQIPINSSTTITPKPSVTSTNYYDTNDWGNCKNNPKCYQS
jgi:parallel beta-helix repeat protein